MPTVKRLRNWRVAIFYADHNPPHVHVVGPGWTVIVNLRPVTTRSRLGCSARQADDVEAAIAPHVDELMTKWSEMHG
jgi:hypothetical protein